MTKFPKAATDQRSMVGSLDVTASRTSNVLGFRLLRYLTPNVIGFWPFVFGVLVSVLIATKLVVYTNFIDKVL